VNSLFGIFVVSLWLIILVPVIGPLEPVI
jgi:hypothetical protein